MPSIHRIKLILTICMSIACIPELHARIPDESISNDFLLTPTPTTTTTSTATTTTTTSAPETFSETNQCFYAEAELCASPPVEIPIHSACQCFPHPLFSRSLVCCNISNVEQVVSCTPSSTTDNSTFWINLHIRNATLDELNFNSISKNVWKSLDSLVITDGSIKKVTQDFTRNTKVKCLNISNNGLTEIPQRAIVNLLNLKILDISQNNLSSIPNLGNSNSNSKTSLIIDIRGNAGMLCKAVLETIERLKFVEPNETFCLINQTFTWFNSTETVPLRELERMKQLQAECPQNCTCVPERMAYENVEISQANVETSSQTRLIFTAKVDCVGLGLTELPKKLPANTIFLNVSRNQIKSLSEFSTNRAYHRIVRFDADDNLVENMLELEGTQFIEFFQILNLRRNKLKSIPTYVISNTLDRNPRGIEVRLEGNRLHCDCNSAKVLRLWLLERQNHITDYDKILCDNMPEKVLELSEKKLCKSKHDWTDYIYYLIAAEVFLLLALIMKVSYDYWVFKTAGYLPWPANKMPKLPCDWLCES